MFLHFKNKKKCMERLLFITIFFKHNSCTRTIKVIPPTYIGYLFNHSINTISMIYVV